MVNIEIYGLTEFGLKAVQPKIQRRFAKKQFAKDMFIAAFPGVVRYINKVPSSHFRVYGDVSESDRDSIVAILLNIGEELEMGVQYIATKYYHPKKRRR